MPPASAQQFPRRPRIRRFPAVGSGRLSSRRRALVGYITRDQESTDRPALVAAGTDPAAVGGGKGAASYLQQTWCAFGLLSRPIPIPANLAVARMGGLIYYGLRDVCVKDLRHGAAAAGLGRIGAGGSGREMLSAFGWNEGAECVIPPASMPGRCPV